MPSKNDLSSVMLKNEQTLQDTSYKKAGRRPKQAHEKCSQSVVLKFTPSEFSKIKKEAGLVPLATFLKNRLTTMNIKKK